MMFMLRSLSSSAYNPFSNVPAVVSYLNHYSAVSLNIIITPPAAQKQMRYNP